MSAAFDRQFKSHEFLRTSQDLYGSGLCAADAADLAARVDTSLRQLLATEPADMLDAVAQTRFIVDAMCEASADHRTAENLRQLCHGHFDQLLRKLAPPRRADATTERNFACFDNLVDRVAVIDTDYRYLFTNKANAAFHGKTPQSFVGRPNWSVVGDKFFEKVNKAQFDACFADRRLSHFVRHPKADQACVFSATFDPLHDHAGRVVGAIVTSRDVSLLPVPSHLIVSMSS